MRRLISTGSPFEEQVGYSRAMVQGDWCFVAGVTGYDYSTMVLPEGITEQAQNCFNTVWNVLENAGFAPEHIVRVTHYVKDRSLFDDLIPILGRNLGAIRPAATMVIAELMKSDMLYELEVTAFKGQ